MKIQVKITMMDGCCDLVPTKAHSDDAAFDLHTDDLEKMICEFTFR